MRNSRLLTTIAVSLLITSIFSIIPTFSVQPPIDASTYCIGTIGQPSRLDPARAYDTASGEIIQNVYQTLIWYADKHPIAFTPDVGYNLTLADYADLTKFESKLSTLVPSIANGYILPDGTGGAYWTFTVNTAATWQPWMAANGSTIPSRALNVNDVVWSFRRQMVVEMSFSPTWMWFMPAFGIQGFQYDNATYPAFSNGTFTSFAVEDTVRDMITGWCYPSGGNDVTFHFQYAWAEVVMYQIFSQTWGSIMNPEFCIEHGDWDGSFANGWSNWYRRKPYSTASALDRFKDPAVYGVHGSKYVVGNHDVPAMLGTGPYNFTSTNWDQTTKTWRIDKWVGYWGGWAGNHVTTVIVKGVDAWPTRKMLFLAGEFDEVNVPGADMYDLLQGDAYIPIPGVNLVYNIPQLENTALLFNMNVSATSPYQAYVGYPTHKTGPVAGFFADQNIRRAFAWAFNYTSYLSDAWFGEAVQQNSWWVDGLSPASYRNANASMPLRNVDLTQMQNYLNAAVINGFNVGTEGFEVTLAYDIGNDQRLIACQLFAQAFLSLGTKYRVYIVGLDWPVFLELRDSGGLALYDVGWLADFADPDSFARAYQHSQGYFMVSQGPPFPEDQAFVDAEIDAAIVEQDSAARRDMYLDLQYRYWLDAPSLPLVQPVGRRWARDWVYGWYFNALFPGIYAYDLYKSVSGVAQPVDIDVTNTLTPITTWKEVYWYKNGSMWIGSRRAVYRFSLSIDRTDNNLNVPTLIAVVSLKRVDLNNTNPATNTFYMSTQLILIAPLETKSLMLTWEEDGTYVDSFPANHTYYISAVASVYSPANAYDVNTANNEVPWGTMKPVGPLFADIKIDGVVGILDSIVLALHFGQKQGDLGWDPNCDLNSDGRINILDCLIFGNNFGNTAPGPQFENP